MNISAVHYAAFAREASRRAAVYSFTEDGEFLLFSAEGRPVVPLWSTISRMDAIRRRDPRFDRCDIRQMELSELGSLLEQLELQGVRIGVNWAGPELLGYDVEPGEVRSLLNLAGAVS